MSNENENKLGEFEFNSTNSDENGWWSPTSTSWDRSTTYPTPTPSPTPIDDGDGGIDPMNNTPTPSPYQIGDLSSWFSYDEAKLMIDYSTEITGLVLKNCNIDHSLKPSSLYRAKEFDTVVWSIVKRDYTESISSLLFPEQEQADDHGHSTSAYMYGVSVFLYKMVNETADETNSFFNISDYLDSAFASKAFPINFSSTSENKIKLLNSLCSCK